MFVQAWSATCDTHCQVFHNKMNLPAAMNHIVFIESKSQNDLLKKKKIVPEKKQW